MANKEKKENVDSITIDLRVLDDMQVVPTQLLQQIIQFLDETPSKFSRVPLNLLQGSQQQGNVLPLSDYLKSKVDDDADNKA